MAFTRAWDEPIKLWDLESGESLGEFGTNDPESAYPPRLPPFILPNHGYATVGDSRIAICTLDTDDLMEMVRSRLTRGFTEEECQRYLRRSCDDEA